MIVRTTILSFLVAAAMPAFAQPPSATDQEMAALREYCKTDIDRLCPKVEPGSGRLKECLMHNQKKLEVGCAQALQKLKK
jgi:hypothetical protein